MLPPRPPKPPPPRPPKPPPPPPPHSGHALGRLRADARGGDGGVRQDLAAGVILVCAANLRIGEHNSLLEMARVDECTLDNNSLRILTLSYARKRHRPGDWVTSSASPNARISRNGTLWNARRSRRFNAREPDHFGPFVDIFCDELGERPASAATMTTPHA
jgi:hypothetical protein